MSNNLDFTAVLSMLAAAYPRYSLTKETTEVYFQLLADIPLETLRAAAVYCATNKDFFPSVHELRQAVAEIARQAGNIPSAYAAWEELQKAGVGYWKEAVEEDGKYYVVEHTYQFSHPAIKKVAQMLGWPREFPGDNPVADRAHFFKAYEQTVGAALDQEVMLPELRDFIEHQRDELLVSGYGRGGKPKAISAYINNPITGEVEILE